MIPQFKRPVGITILACVFLWIGCLGSLVLPFFLTSDAPRIWTELTGTMSQHYGWIRFGVYPFRFFWYLIYVAYAFIGFGLWKLRDWARRAVLGFSIFIGPIFALYWLFTTKPISMAVASVIWTVFVLGWIVFYLNRPRVRFVFEMTSSLLPSESQIEMPPEMSKREKKLTGIAVFATFALYFCALAFAIHSELR